MLETGQKLKTESKPRLGQPLFASFLKGDAPERRLYLIAVGLAIGATIVAALVILTPSSGKGVPSLWLQVGVAALVLAFNVVGDKLSTDGRLSTSRWQIGALVVAFLVFGASFFAGEYLNVLLAPLLVGLAPRRRDQQLLIGVALSAVGLILVENLVLALTGWHIIDTGPEQGAVAAIIVISTIALSLAALIGKYRTEISTYQKEQATKASEMEVAHEIQTSLMPPSEIVTGAWRMAAKSIPALDVGGDFYEYIPHLDQGIGGVAIGDVAGKGIPAALQMAVVRTLFRVEARRRIFPAETLMSVNMALQAERSFGMVTLLYGFVDQASSTLHLSNAGHNYPIILNGSLTEVRLPGLPLGIDDGIEYEERKVHIAPGTSIIFYTDGVIEAMNEDGELYGFPRLKGAVMAHQHSEPHEMVDLILQDVATFTEGASQSDDITVVVIQHSFQDSQYVPEQNEGEGVSGEDERQAAWVAAGAAASGTDEFEEGNWI